jgi:hypothetical protein
MSKRIPNRCITRQSRDIYRENLVEPEKTMRCHIDASGKIKGSQYRRHEKTHEVGCRSDRFSIGPIADVTRVLS